MIKNNILEITIIMVLAIAGASISGCVNKENVVLNKEYTIISINQYYVYGGFITGITYID